MVKNANRYRWQVAGVALFIFALAVGLSEGIAVGQEAPVVISGSAGRPMNAEQAKAMMDAQKAAAAQAAGQAGAQPAPDAKKEGEQKPAEGEKKEEAATTVKRPENPPKVPDPNDFKVSVDDKGRVPPFNFIGQPWPDVMQWLATNSKSSLDWQELPNDYLNLTTRRSYTIDEVRDLINSHLNARGFTAIQNGEMLRVFKIEKLDPSVVRRVEEEDLYDLPPYDFVKLSFELPAGMEVEKAKEDIKQVLSPNAKVFPLVTTKRLLVMDSVANLRLVSALLNEERAVQDGRIVPDEIPLKYARAEKVIDILYVVLGLDPQSRPTQMELQLQQQKLQLMTQMQQQGKDVMSMLKKDGPPVFLAYNKQRNSIIANAPPEQMKIIHQTIKYLDVPFGDEGTIAGGPEAGPNNGQRITKKYPLTTLDPDNFVLTLEEIGELSPSAEFRVDKKSKTLFATATESDHVKINGLIDQFDGSGREFHVIPLRRLPADAVAATIYNLMAGQQEEEEDNNRRPYWYYDPWERNEDKDKPVQGFGVDADIENNRLMLWANDAEYQRVQDLLIKLGEIPSGQQDVSRVRFVQPGSNVPAAQLLEQIRAAWSASGNNDLIINMPTKVDTEAKDAEKSDEVNEQEVKPAEPFETIDRAASYRPSRHIPAQFVQLEAADEDSAQPAPSNVTPPAAAAPPEEKAGSSPTDAAAALAKPAPVTINVTEDGRLMISSSDPVALDRMEELIGQLTPPERRFKVYELKFVKAFDMYYNLKELFKEELEGEEGGNDFYDWYFGFRPRNNQEKGPSGLSKRRKLMITYDPPSNTILVANASPSQLNEIEELIKEYDKPVPADSVRTRRMALIKIKYSKASTIAQALKEVYVDLLSSKDKEFDRGGDQRQRGSSTERTTIIRYSDGSSGGNQRQSPVKVGFEGALSIGVDDISNTLLISVQEELYASVVGMVERLDKEAASDTVVKVHRVNGNVAAAALRETINGAMGLPWLGGKPDPNAARGRGGRDGRRDDGDRNRDRGRDRNRNRRDRDGDNNRNNGDNNDNNNNDNDND
jgi:type II secretory pathway component GspD/PulD (secretin)